MRPRTLTPYAMLCLLLASLAIGVGGCGGPTMKLGEWGFGDVLRVRVVALERVSQIAYLDDWTQWVEGEVLGVRIMSMERAKEVGFSDGTKHLLLRPKNEGNELLALWIDLHNLGDETVSLSLDSEAVEVVGTGGTGPFLPLDPYGQAVALERPSASEGRYTQFLRGNVEVQPDFYLSGWVIFEVPKGTKLKGVTWRELETVPVQFRHLVLRPKEPGNELVAVQMDVANYGASKIFLSIDSESVELSDEKAVQIWNPIDPFTEGVEVERPVGDETKFLPFLWKPTELDMETQVSGWMIFEVPKGTVFKRLVWREADSVYVYFF